MGKAPRLRRPLRPRLRPLLLPLVGLALTVGALTGQEQVLATLERRLAANPRDPAALEQLGLEHLRRGEHAQALVQLHKSIAVSPERGLAWFYVGLVYYEKGLLFREIQAYERCLLHAPDFLPARLNLAHAYLTAGRVPDAIEQYREVERRDPQNLTVMYNLGILFADLNHPEDARRYLDRYLTLAPQGALGRERAAEIRAELEAERTG